MKITFKEVLIFMLGFIAGEFTCIIADAVATFLIKH